MKTSREASIRAEGATSRRALGNQTLGSRPAATKVRVPGAPVGTRLKASWGTKRSCLLSSTARTRSRAPTGFMTRTVPPAATWLSLVKVGAGASSPSLSEKLCHMCNTYTLARRWLASPSSPRLS
ncbi:MAG: hypothetical protein KA712_11270 [Myxococcales bacterium]|nr:hypothetical protein [Myxococcales bacterium]